MIVAALKESAEGERRVAITPASAAALIKAGHSVRVEHDAGLAAGFTDDAYRSRGAAVTDSADGTLQDAAVVLAVRVPVAAEWFQSGQVVVGFADPLTSPHVVQSYAERSVTLMAMELVPRTSRAQSMDALSSQANLAGYRAVLMAAMHLPQIFPLMMTAAGTVQPARVLIVGAGVAGLQAIATAKRLGAIVSSYDVRAAVKEQIQSLGAKFVELPIEAAEGVGGYAKEQTPEQLAQQRELLGNVVAEQDVLITTAAVPGRPAPKIITAEMARRMKPGSVIVDLAAERGGNCELTQPGEIITEHGITIDGSLNLPSGLARHASELYANNLVKLLTLLSDKDGTLKLNMEDDIIAGACVTCDRNIVNPALRSES